MPGSFVPTAKSDWRAWSRTHSGARFEAEERGLVEELAAFPVEDGPVMDALSFADMTIGPAGQPMTLDERTGEIQRRYPPDDPVHRAIVRARPLLQAAIDRNRDRLERGPAQPILGELRCSR